MEFNNLATLFQQLWLTDTQYRIFTTIYQYWSKPASTIAKIINQERTNIYKSCEVLTKRGLLGETIKWWVKHFFVPDNTVLQRLIDQQRELLDQSAKLIPLAQAELANIGEWAGQHIPAMRFYEGQTGIEQCFNDLYNDIIQNGYIVIKMFATNTLDKQNISPYAFRDYWAKFLQKLQEKNITLESYLGNGIMMLESLLQTNKISDITDLPAGNSALNCFVFWETVYIIIYKNIPIAWRIRNEEFAQMLHFLLKLNC